MGNNKQENLLFEEMDFEGKDKEITLNKQKLLSRIEDTIKSDTRVELREKVYKLKSDVSKFNPDKDGLWNIFTSRELVKINQKYLFDEFKQIVASHSLERSIYYLKRLCKGIANVRTNKVNDLNLNQWKEYDDILTDSLWILKKRDSSGVHNSVYWGNFIPQIPQQLMKRYTKKGEWVLDTFAGCGTTLIEAQRLGRNSIGIELQEDVVAIANGNISFESNPHNTFNKVFHGDSCTVDYEAVLQKAEVKKVQLLIMHPPYFDIIKFSDDSRDLSNAKDVDNFLQKMNMIVSKASQVLDKGRYFALVIGDKYTKGEWIPLGFLTMQEVLKSAFTLKSIIVKNFEETFGKRNQKELWRYRALVGGFYIFKHEYIFLFKKK